MIEPRGRAFDAEAAARLVEDFEAARPVAMDLALRVDLLKDLPRMLQCPLTIHNQLNPLGARFTNVSLADKS